MARARRKDRGRWVCFGVALFSILAALGAPSFLAHPGGELPARVGLPQSSRTNSNSGAFSSDSLVSRVPSTRGDPTFEGTSAGAGWANLSSLLEQSPPARSSIEDQMVYDPTTGYELLFGGFSADSAFLNDTWAFENGDWTELFPAHSPPTLDHASMAWDAKDGYAVLFGGAGSGYGPSSETWVFRGGNWTQLYPLTSPSGRWGSSMTWDPAEGYVLLFGGCDSGIEMNDTWSFVGGNWTNLSIAHAPAPREDAALAFDAQTQQMVLFGGEDTSGAGTLYNDTWEFSNGTWTMLHPSGSPSARWGASMAYFAPGHEMVLDGGTNFTFAIDNDSWSYAADTWTRLAGVVPPPVQATGALAPGASTSLLLFGGGGRSTSALSATWVYYAINLTVTPSSVRGEAPLNVSFQANATGGSAPTAVQWTFGDATNGTGDSLDHTFTVAGNYTVSVHAEDGLGVASSLNFTIEVLPPLLVSASAGPLMGSAPLPVTFNASAEGGEAPYAFDWAPTAGTSIPDATSTYTYSSPGTYTASLTVTDTLGVQVERNLTIQVSPEVPPVPAFTLSASANRTEGEAPFAVQFNASAAGGTSPYSFSWAFGDGSTSTALSPTYVYSSPGRYQVNLSAVDAASVNATAPDLTILVLAHVSVSSGIHVSSGQDPLSEEFMATASDGVSPYTFVWTFGDGGTGSGASTSHTYPAAGSYNVSVEVIDALGNTAQGSIPVSISPPPSSSNSSPAWYASATTWEIVGAAAVGVVIGALVTRTIGRGGRRQDAPPASTDSKGES